MRTAKMAALAVVGKQRENKHGRLSHIEILYRWPR
jgi:hypothetical protein